jgi:hypothetical protein
MRQLSLEQTLLHYTSAIMQFLNRIERMRVVGGDMFVRRPGDIFMLTLTKI